MAGSGRRVFQPGEVLTASNVMNYLQDQAVQVYAGTAARGSAIGTAVSEGMVSYLADNNFVQTYDGTAWRSLAGVQAVSGTATRDAVLPSPIQGDKVFRTDLGYEQTYYAAWGTANPGGRASAGWYDNQRNMGLVPIVPPTVNVSGGTATANTLGVVSFTSASSISLNNIFSSQYSRYKINFVAKTTTATPGVDFYGKFRLNGTDISTGYYGSAIYNAYNAGLTNSAQFSNTAYGYIGYFGGLDGTFSTIEIAPSSSVSGWSIHQRNSAAASQHIGGFNTTTSSGTDGFTIYPTSLLMSGTIQVFGYNS